MSRVLATPEKTTASAAASHPQRIPSLDGLRAIAILMVVFGHAFGHGERSATFGWIQRILFNAPQGVQIFFVLSGFLITSILLKEMDRTGAIDLKGFYRRRFYRIFPASYFYLTVIFLLTSAGVLGVSWNLLVYSFLFVLNYQALTGAPSEDYWFVGHFWTLCVEQQFYLLWPWALSVVGRMRGLRLALLAIVAMPALRLLHYALFPNLRGQLGMMFHTGADSIFIGSCLAIVVQARPRWRQRMGDLPWIAPAALTLWIFVISPMVGEKLGGGWTLLAARTINGLVIAALLLCLVEHPNSRFGRVLNWPPIVYVGAISYGLYLWQQLFLYQTETRPVLQIWLGILAAFMVASLSFHFFEQPILRFSKRRS